MAECIGSKRRVKLLQDCFGGGHGESESEICSRLQRIITWQVRVAKESNLRVMDRLY
jgi:hypothetical protein